MTMSTRRNNRRRSCSLQRRPPPPPPHFFQIILQTAIDDKKMRVPVKFVDEFRDDLSAIVTVTDPYGLQWQLGLEKTEEDIWFCEGWEKFVNYYSIKDKTFIMVFRYEGNSTFHVLIFDLSASEIQYHRRPSNSPERRLPPPWCHFFKIIFPTTVYDKKLRLPAKFLNEFGDELSAVVTLADPCGREWQVGVERIEDNTWFNEGWERFVNHYSITSGFYLVFRYEGHSKFHVLIFDMNACEIQYPSYDPNPGIQEEYEEESTMESEKEGSEDDNNDDDHYNNDDSRDDDYNNDDLSDDDEDESDDSEHSEADDDDDDFDSYYYSSSPSESLYHNRPRGRGGFTKFIDKRRIIRKHSSDHAKSSFQRKRKRLTNTMHEKASNHHRSKSSDHGSSGKIARTCPSKRYYKRHISDKVRAKVMDAANKYRPQYPSFTVVLRPQNFYNQFVYVPAPFCEKYLKAQSLDIKLQSSANETEVWDARCFPRIGSGKGSSIGRGWSKFSKDKMLEEGDVCTFELIKRKEIVLRVKIFRISKYARK